MKMKRFISILFVTALVVLFSINAHANKERWYSSDDRSIFISLSIEENNLFIYSDKQLDNISIQMIDPDGQMIYMDIITIPAEEELIRPFSYLPEGHYQVILTKDNQPVTWYLVK